MLLIIFFAITTGTSTANNELLPDAATCGYENTSSQVYKFPWMVHVKLSNFDYQYEFADRCSGVLINDQYVLTNAYCGTQAVKVVLGQYQTNETISCQDLHCIGQKKEIAVEEQIRDGKQENGPYDFCLLRLGEKVLYSDSIRPICLNLNTKKDIPKDLEVSGWGAMNWEGVAKKHMHYGVVLDEVCYGLEDFLKNNVEFAKVSFLCAVPDTNNNIEKACNGDHGGPFMYKSNLNRWFVEGVIVQIMHPNNESNYFNTCTKDRPINGIRITSDVVEWILASLRP